MKVASHRIFSFVQVHLEFASSLKRDELQWIDSQIQQRNIR